MNYDQWKEQGFDDGLDGEEYPEEPEEEPPMFRDIIARAMDLAYPACIGADDWETANAPYARIAAWCERRYR